MAETADIRGYHAHVYYADPDGRAQAMALREVLDVRFPVVLGRSHDVPVGPHPQPMYQVAFATETFAALVPWLMLNRRGLSVLVHPLTGDDLADHRDSALWLGTALPLDLSVLERPAPQPRA